MKTLSYESKLKWIDRLKKKRWYTLTTREGHKYRFCPYEHLGDLRYSVRFSVVIQQYTHWIDEAVPEDMELDLTRFALRLERKEMELCV